MPDDFISLFEWSLSGAPEWKAPLRKWEQGRPKITDTPTALLWLFTPHGKDDQPSLKLEPRQALKALNIAPYWKPWEKPMRGLAIDESIEKLILASDEYKKNGRPKAKSPREQWERSGYETRSMISRAEFSSIGLKNGSFENYDCPYEYVRRELSYAVGLAYDDLAAVEENELNLIRLNQSNEILLRAFKDISILAENISRNRIVPEKQKYVRKKEDLFLRTNSHKLVRRNIDIALEAICAANNEIKDQIKTYHNGGRPEDTWWISFIISCGFIWSNLTGIPPRVGQAEFYRFVANATESLDKSAVATEAKIKTALSYVNGAPETKRSPQKDSRMMEWNRFDAERKGVLPPGSFPVAFGEEANILLEKSNTIIRDKIIRMKQGDPEAGIYILGLIALKAGKERVQFLEMLKQYGIQEGDLEVARDVVNGR